MLVLCGDFAKRYIAGMKSMDWAIDPVLAEKMASLAGDYGSSVGNPLNLDRDTLADYVRSIARWDTGDANVANWTTSEAMAWMRGFDDTELEEMMYRVGAGTSRVKDPVARKAQSAIAQMQQRLLKRNPTDAVKEWDFKSLRPQFTVATDSKDMLQQIISSLPGGALRSRTTLLRNDVQEAIAESPLLRWINENDRWDEVIAFNTNIEHITEAVSGNAAIAAISDVVPFLDSHEFKTQFAEYGKGLMPFWYAEENFLKRWARALNQEGPAMIRKAQLTYMGIKEAGLIRTDANGKDWFVYPGSGLLIETVSKMFPTMGAEYAMGIMFQAPTDRILPGMTPQFGTPSFNPLVTMPMAIVAGQFPELVPLQRAVTGDLVASRGIVDQIIPTTFKNIFTAFSKDESAGSKYASAQMAAIAYLEANGHGLPPEANAGDIEQFMDRVRGHARIILIAQAVGGFTMPGAPTAVEAEDTGFGAFNVQDPGEMFNDEYLSLVRLLGVEAGTAKFLEMNPDADPSDIANPNPILAYTTPRSVSESGAPIYATEDALGFFIDNQDYFADAPYAAPWLFPPSDGTEPRSQYAADQMVAAGMRKQRSPEEFLRALKFKQGASEYFAIEDKYLDAISLATQQNNKQLADDLKTRMEWEKSIFRAGHPLFAEELQSSDNRDRRKRVIDEMQYVIDDPALPDTPQARPIRMAMRAFNQYRTELAVLSEDRSNVGRAQVAALKERYAVYMNQLIEENPGIMSFWNSILKPESSLD